MAYLGCGFYKKKIPLRAIGVFPTWDRLIFAVRKDSGIESLEDIKRQKYPLRISTRRRDKLQTTVYAIEEVLKAYGMSFKQIERWGGKVMEAASPSSKDRRDHIQSGKPTRCSTKASRAGEIRRSMPACVSCRSTMPGGAPHEQGGISPSAMLTRSTIPNWRRPPLRRL